MEKYNQDGTLQDPEMNIDSPYNTEGTEDQYKDSLTNDESADTDPNDVKNKPSFKKDKNINERGRFDGEIGI